MESFIQSSTPRFAEMTKVVLPFILIIENQSYPVGWTKQLFEECIEKGYLCRIMMIEQQIVGYYVVQVILDEYHILNLCVAPEFQGNGLGKYQLENILQCAELDTMNRILLEVRQSNKRARKLYSQSGFQIIGKRKNYYPLPEGREDAQVMELALG